MTYVYEYDYKSWDQVADSEAQEKIVVGFTSITYYHAISIEDIVSVRERGHQKQP